MIRPTYQDIDRRVVFVSNKYLSLDNPIQYAKKHDVGYLVRWNENKIDLLLDSHPLSRTYDPENLFWEDGLGDFNERSILNVNEA